MIELEGRRKLYEYEYEAVLMLEQDNVAWQTRLRMAISPTNAMTAHSCTREGIENLSHEVEGRKLECRYGF